MGRSTPQPVAVVVLAVIGVLITGFIVMSMQPRWSARSIDGIEAAENSANLSVIVLHNVCGNGGPHVRIVRQSGDRVVLRAEQDERGDCDDIGLTTVFTVTLDSPLLDRPILIEPASFSMLMTCLIDGAPSDRCVQA